jgi:hypothetical protein
MGHQLQPKILDTIGSLQRQTAEEPYTPYQEMVQPLQTEEGGIKLKRTNLGNDPRHHFFTLRLAWTNEISPPVCPSHPSHRPRQEISIALSEPQEAMALGAWHEGT